MRTYPKLLVICDGLNSNESSKIDELFESVLKGSIYKDSYRRLTGPCFILRSNIRPMKFLAEINRIKKKGTIIHTFVEEGELKNDKKRTNLR